MSDRALVYSNKKCYQREIEHQQRIHRQKLASIKPTSQTAARTGLDLTRPATMDLKHVRLNAKRLLVRPRAARASTWRGGV